MTERMQWIPAVAFVALAAAATAALLSLDFIRELGVGALWLADWRWILALAAAFLVLRFLVALVPAAAGHAGLRFATTALPAFVLLAGAGAWGLADLRRENHAEPYRVEFKKQGSLMERVAGMPDAYRGCVALQWLRTHLAGTTVVAAEGTLREAGLAAHRLAGLAQMDLKLVPRDPPLPARVQAPAVQATLVRINPGVPDPEVWVETGPGQPGAWCAARWRTGVLLLRAASAAECGP